MVADLKSKNKAFSETEKKKYPSYITSFTPSGFESSITFMAYLRFDY